MCVIDGIAYTVRYTHEPDRCYLQRAHRFAIWFVVVVLCLSWADLQCTPNEIILSSFWKKALLTRNKNITAQSKAEWINWFIRSDLRMRCSIAVGSRSPNGDSKHSQSERKRKKNNLGNTVIKFKIHNSKKRVVPPY